MGGRKPPRKEIGNWVVPFVNRTGRPKVVTSIPNLLGHYRQLLVLGIEPREDVVLIIEVEVDGGSMPVV